ncbi:MAG TPA: amidohydrolase family protein [Verrucomicrobiales bacterium]|nr:amidohydrolase family protein [Verrucomicrobiales bacterium]
MKPRRLLLSPPVAAGTVLTLIAGWFLWGKVETGESRALNDLWRKEHRIIDLHMHIEGMPERFDRAIRIMDRAGVGIGVNLSGGVVTHKDGEQSEFARNKALADTKYPGRFVTYMNLDYAGWNEPDFSEKAAKQIEEGRRLGAAGFKEYKRLGLYLKDKDQKLIHIDDPKLDAVWAKCGELGMPVSIHVADPRAFWLPRDENNERWKELKDHESWWFGNPNIFPKREELLEALDRVIARHPKTTFVCVHFANNSEDIQWVDRMLDKRPNMMADLAARIPEIGRHAPEEVRRIFTKHKERILFATDFMVYNRLILGSAGDAERPTDDEGVVFYNKCWRWMETNDRDWAHMTPIQGDWTINSINLPPDVCRAIYFDNAAKLLARSLPLPVMKAARADKDFQPDGKLDDPAWATAAPVRLEYQSGDASARPAISTAVRALWTDNFLYLGYEAPYTRLETFSPVQAAERIGLWDKDVVEAFIGTDPAIPGKYTEYEWSPSGEKLDLAVNLPAKDFEWSSKMESAVTIDEAAKVWRLEVRIPMKSLAANAPAPGTRWRLNLFRHDTASNAGLAFSPALTGTFHTPERFGWLELAKP